MAESQRASWERSALRCDSRRSGASCCRVSNSLGRARPRRCPRVHFGTSVSAGYLEASGTTAAVAREVGVNALGRFARMSSAVVDLRSAATNTNTNTQI